MKDYHVHTCFCDGKNTPEELVLAAIGLGMEELGLVTHSYTFFDERYCIEKDRVGEFQTEIARLKARYGDRLRILCGVEQDVWSTAPTAGFDYVIGSVHYVKCADLYCPVDESREILQKTVDNFFGGDFFALADAYYQTVAQVAERTKPDISGHFDLISKFNEGGALFDETDSRYVRSWQAALDALLPYGIPFELNTGAMSRGYRSAPYPGGQMRDYITSHGGSLLLSSDSHDVAALCFAFGEWSI